MGSSGRKPLAQSEREILEQRGWLSVQPAAFRAKIFEGAVSLVLSPGDAVYSLGDPPGGLYAVCDGYLDVLIAPGQQTPHFVHVARAGWWVGDGALISGTPRRAGLIARTDLKIAYIPADAVEKVCRDDPEGWRMIGRLTVGMFDHALALATAERLPGPEERVRAALLRLVGDGLLYGVGGEDDPVSFPISQSDLAELAGLSRNAAMPALARLEEAAAITRGYRRITVIDRTLLQPVNVPL